jgi:endothelin-converting enzyme/putative endopeptidase
MRLRKAWVSVLLVAAFLLSSSRLFSQSSSLHGIDVGDLDRRAEPCDDFFQVANGTWRANNPIPASVTRWSRRWQAGESSKDELREILEAASADQSAPPGRTEQIIGDYYDACMDESRLRPRPACRRWCAISSRPCVTTL